MSPADNELAGEVGSEVVGRADFSSIRYAQCWEDADVLLDALAVQPGDTCVSIASAGDNSLALLLGDPREVIAVDLSPAQLACLDLRIAAYRVLEHDELLALIGSRDHDDRGALYARCRPQLADDSARFWDAHPADVAAGIGSAGKFERYFKTFRTRVMPLVHTRGRIDRLLAGGPPETRRAYYDRSWNTWRWRAMFRFFFSRFVMGRLGRDPSFFKYVEGSVAERILNRTKHALTELDPAANPYLQWILVGRHATALPLALRPEHFDTIRARVDRVTWRRASLEDVLADAPPASIDRFNLSDIFEYMNAESFEQLLNAIVRAARPGGRLAYWNMLVPRSRPESLASRLDSLETLGDELLTCDKAFFYSRFVVEEVRPAPS